MSKSRFDAVLFDCDGVLVDSEPITNGVLHDMLHEQGWTITRADCMRIFVGKAVKDEAALIEERTGRPVTAGWLAQFRERRNAALERGLVLVRHADVVVQTLYEQYGGRIACASGADLFKVRLQLEKVGLMRWFEGRIFSGHDLPRSKPFPDVYLAAAAAVGADPLRCAVVEDTVTGATAGVAAGCTVFGFSPPEAGHDAPETLRRAGARMILDDLRQLPELLARHAPT